MTQKPHHDWQALTELTQGKAFVVERVRLVESGVAIEGGFEPPQLAWLSAEDQVFVAAFLKSHGSIKEMEAVFGVSYPTIKARLNRLRSPLRSAEFFEIEEIIDPRDTRAVLTRWVKLAQRTLRPGRVAFGYRP